MSGADLQSRGMQVSSDAFAPSRQPEEEEESLNERVEMVEEALPELKGSKMEEEVIPDGKDWAKSSIYQMVLKQKSLPRGDKAKAKAVEEEYFNPMKVDIYTEQEVDYNASLIKNKRLRKSGSLDAAEGTDDENDPGILE